MIDGDNPPVGILLCTDKGDQMVEYALSGMDNQLFVSTYMLHLPDKSQLEEFIKKELQKYEDKKKTILLISIKCRRKVVEGKREASIYATSVICFLFELGKFLFDIKHICLSFLYRKCLNFISIAYVILSY